MSSPLEFRSCDELDPAVIERAFDPSAGSPREQVLKLLERMGRVAKPGRGAHRILEVLARLARSAWVEGALDVVLRDFGLATEIDIRVDVGKRLERLKTLSVAVPMSELADWAGEHPESLAPLVVFDGRRDDELRLRKATTRVTHVPRSPLPTTPPAVAPGPGSAPPSRPPISSARRPIAAASRRGRTSAEAPGSSRRPPGSAPEAEIHARVTLPDTEADVRARAEADVHRRDTPRLLRVELPEEAYRTGTEKVERKTTTRIPAVRPPATSPGTNVDPTDEGWE